MAFNIKKKLFVFSVILSLIIFSFFLAHFIQDSNYLSEKYGINITVLAIAFVTAEIFFNIGIVLMLKGSGVFNVRWFDIKNFNFEKVKFRGKVVYSGFVINRLAAFVPWLYPLTAGWNRLPLFITILIITELLVVVLIGMLIKIPRHHENSYSPS